jgi:hypothetical protein
VCFEGFGELAFELVDLPRQLQRDGDRCAYGRGKRPRQLVGLSELVRAERALDLRRSRLQVALPAGPFQRRAQRRERQPPAPLRAWRSLEHRERVAAAELAGERLERLRVRTREASSAAR